MQYANILLFDRKMTHLVIPSHNFSFLYIAEEKEIKVEINGLNLSESLSESIKIPETFRRETQIFPARNSNVFIASNFAPESFMNFDRSIKI